MILAGDIGGTNTRLAMFDAENLQEPRYLKVYPSGDYESLRAIVDRFIREAKEEAPEAVPARAGFGVAGPVNGKIVKLTNLPWEIDSDLIADLLGIGKVVLVNDFYANSLAVPRLRPGDVRQIGAGKPIEQKPIAVLGAGTGLGEAFLIWSGEDYLVLPSEGGHTDFAPRTPQEIRLLEFLTARFNRVSYERVLSGPGLVNIYQFFRERENMVESTAVREAMVLDDAAAVSAMRRLAEGTVDPPVVAGESAVAGICGLAAMLQDPNVSCQLSLGPHSRVLVFGTEGDSDPETYTKLVGRSSQDVRASPIPGASRTRPR